MPGKAPGLASYKVFEANINGKRRTVLANPEIAEKVAKAMTTKAIRSGSLQEGFRTYSKAEAKTAKAFGKGVRNMATRNASTEQLYKIKQMDDQKLKDLYDHNKFVFEVYFQYEGIEQQGKTIITSGTANKNAQFLIEQYERAYGSLGQIGT